MRAFLREELRHGARSALRPAGPWGHALRRGEATAAAYSGGETASSAAQRWTRDGWTPCQQDHHQPPNDESSSSGSQIISKGKHKGLLYRECLARDPHYCHFLVSRAHVMGGEYRGLIEYIRSQQADEHDASWNNHGPDETPVQSGGLHCHNTSDEVPDEAPGEVPMESGHSPRAAVAGAGGDLGEAPVGCGLLDGRGAPDEEAPTEHGHSNRDALAGTGAILGEAPVDSGLFDRRGASDEEAATEHGHSHRALAGTGAIPGEAPVESVYFDCHEASGEVWDDAPSESRYSYHQEAPGGGDTVLGFGKYRGMTWQQVVEDDPDYCQWVVREVTTRATRGDPPRQDFVEFMVYIQGSAAAVGASAAPAPAPLGRRGQGYKGAGAFESEARESPPLFSGKWPITFGTKYKNWTFDEVVKADKPYCDYIVQQVLHSRVPKGPRMTAFAFYVQHVRFALGVQAST